MELFEILADTPWLLTGSVFVLSLLVGSFLNVVIHRLPIMLDRQWRAQAEEMLGSESDARRRRAARRPTSRPYNLVTPRSTCPHCNAAIKAHQNIPVLSYLLLGGKCANCKAQDLARATRSSNSSRHSSRRRSPGTSAGTGRRSRRWPSRGRSWRSP